MNPLFNESEPKPVKVIMGHTSLKSIIQKAFSLLEIEQKIDSLLPEYHQRLQVLNIKKGCLILASCSSALATQLRFREEELLAQLNVPSIWRIQCLVKPSRSDTTRTSLFN